jgi:Tol biopolymer transport system component
MPVKHVFAKVRLLPGSFLALLVLSLLALIASPSATALASSSSVAPGSSQASAAVQKSPWNAFIYGYDYNFGRGSYQGLILNQDASSNRFEALTQYVVQMPLYYSVSPDGKNVVFSQLVNGMRQYWTALGPRPASGFFYEGIDSPVRGNVLWTSDSRHVLVLDSDKGVSLVDTQTGKAQRVLSLPYRASNITVPVIDSLVYSRDNYIYFFGGRTTGPCARVLCRVSLTGKPQITPLPQIFSSGNFLMSPDGKTIYYHNVYQSGPQGIYAMNADGTHNRLVRLVKSTPGTLPLQLGFGAHNELIFIHQVGTKFQLVQLGATPRQDRVLVADVAPGLSSLCGTGYTYPDVCPGSVMLSPDAHAIVAYGTAPNGHDQFWVTNLQTGQQRAIAVVNSNQRHDVTLLGWDKLSFCTLAC